MNKDLTRARFAKWISTRIANTESRQLLVLSASEDAVCESIAPLCIVVEDAIKEIAQSYPNAIYVGNFSEQLTHCLSNNIKPAGLLQQLGTQYEALILDCREGWQPNHLYAASGLVQASGLLVLLTPNPATWSHYYSQHAQIKFSFGDNHTHSLFSDYLFNAFVKDKQVAWHSPNSSSLPVLTDAPLISLEDCADGFVLSKQQQDVLSKIESSWNVKAPTSHFITGARGRGKSTLLSKLCERAFTLGQQSPFSQIAVCAPTKLQRDIVKHYIDSSLVKSQSLLSIAPDQSELLNSSTLLLIDEAASISPDLLSGMCEKTPYCVLSATTQGYEGSGKGLIYRWLPNVAHRVDQHMLSMPFRWRQNDPLELLINKIFEPPQRSIKNQQTHNYELYLFDKRDFNQHLGLFEACFSLLQQAHYQSTPMDIMRMLDAQDHQIYGYTRIDQPFNPSHLIGVVCTISEGGNDIFEDTSLRKSIANGKRRVQGHLGLQAIASGIHQEQILGFKTCRIHRIAVMGEHQRMGIGTKMLSCLHKRLSVLNNTGCSTSYGLTNTLVSFWERNGYALVKLGHRKDTSSGTLTGHYLHTSSKLYSAIANKTRAHINIDIVYLKVYQKHLYDLVPNSILSDYSNDDDPVFTASLVSKKLNLFINQELSYSMIKSSIFYLIRETDNSALRAAFNTLHQKHLSQSEKQSLESLISDQIHDWLSR